MYLAKEYLPGDFPLITRDEDYYIVIECPMSNFAWRTVEDRLAIALVLENLCKFVKEEGIECAIEKC